jgi:hypothetical protein
LLRSAEPLRKIALLRTESQLIYDQIHARCCLGTVHTSHLCLSALVAHPFPVEHVAPSVAQTILALAVVAQVVLAGPGHNHVKAEFNVTASCAGLPPWAVATLDDETCTQIPLLGNGYFKLKSCTVRV